jgi:hypothetical protein
VITDQWIQLAGNHEAQYLPGGTPFWRDPLAAEGVARLRDWWADGSMRVAAAVRTVVSFTDRRWRCTGRVRQRATADWAARHVTVRVSGRQFVGVDPGHGRTGATRWAPLTLHDALTPIPRQPPENLCGRLSMRLAAVRREGVRADRPGQG